VNRAVRQETEQLLALGGGLVALGPIGLLVR
jgi:hypothetical protein